MKQFIVITILLCSPLIATAKSSVDMELNDSAYHFLQVCEEYHQSTGNNLNGEIQVLVCGAWIDGLINGYLALNEMSQQSLFKPPTGIPRGLLTKVIIKYMNDNPKLLTKSTSYVVLEALTHDYPPDKH